MRNDKKNIIVYNGLEAEDSFGVPPAFEESDTFVQTVFPDAASFLATHQGEPFLSALRALYREVCYLEKDEIKPDIRGVKRKLIQIMDMQMRSLAESGYDNTNIMIVRYLIATFIDELLGKVEWNNSETWANHSLLGHYYKETYGGEKFFQLLERLAQEPNKYIEHMKLIYVCLSLGYRGRYSLAPNSDVQIESIRQELFVRIKRYGTHEDKFYKDHPVSNIAHKLTLNIPYRLFFLGGLLVLVIVYAVFTGMVVENENELMEIFSTQSTVEHKKGLDG